MSVTLLDSALYDGTELVGHRELTEEDKECARELQKEYRRAVIWESTPFFWIQCKIRNHREKKDRSNPFSQ